MVDLPLGSGSPFVRFLNVISTKRSGHHALIKWIETGSPVPTRFINNAAINPELFGRISDLVRNIREPTTIILNYEGVTPAGVGKVLTVQKDSGASVQNVLFVRDPLNACASLMQRKAVVYAELVMILRQLFALKNWLDLYQQGKANADLVFYNRWLADDDYRASVAQRLGINAQPVGTEVTAFGGGSSFRDLAQGGAAAAPKLLNRWKAYEHDAVFRSLVSHPLLAGTFHDELRGAITDSAGESDRDSGRASFLDVTKRARPSNTVIDRTIVGLNDDQQAFEAIEALPSSMHKRALILKAHMRALLNGSPQTEPAHASVAFKATPPPGTERPGRRAS